MSRMKTFFVYAIIIILFYFLSNILIYLFIKGTYKDITGEIVSDNIEVIKAKSTYVNGYIDGKITNNAMEELIDKYVKIEIYSKRGVCLGIKYIDIPYLEAGEEKEFHIGYKLKDAYRYKISVVENVNEATEEQFISEEMKWYIIAATLIVAIFI